jgi:hypothetical protein
MFTPDSEIYVIITITYFWVFFVLLACDSQLYLTCYITPNKLQEVIVDDSDLVIEDVDFSDKYLALIVRENQHFQLCSVGLPLPFGKVIKENFQLWHSYKQAQDVIVINHLIEILLSRTYACDRGQLN